MKRKKLRILFECSQYLPSIGGIELGTHAIAKEMIKLGHEVTVVCQNYSYDGKPEEIIEGVKIFRYPKLRFSKFFAPFSFSIQQKTIKKYLVNFLNKRKFDLIVSRFFLFVKPTKKLAPKTPLLYMQPSVLYIAYREMAKNSLNFPDKFINFIKSKTGFFMEKSALEMADKIGAASTSMAEINTKIFGINKRKMKIIARGLAMDKFKPRGENRWLMKKLRLEKGKTILNVSRLTADKNTSGLLKVFSSLKSKDAKLAIIGDGPEMENLKNLSEELGISKRVLFLGEKKHIEGYYGLGDIFVLASKNEGFGNVLLEAIASGIPIIGYKTNLPRIVTATVDIIGGKRIGFAVKNEKEMAEKIDLLLSNEKLRRKMGRLARKQAQKYSWKKVAEKLLEIAQEK